MAIIFFYFLHQPLGIPNKLLTVSTAKILPGRGLKKHEICTAAFDGHLLSGVGGHVPHRPLFPLQISPMTWPRSNRLLVRVDIRSTVHLVRSNHGMRVQMTSLESPETSSVQVVGMSR